MKIREKLILSPSVPNGSPVILIHMRFLPRKGLSSDFSLRFEMSKESRVELKFSMSEINLFTNAFLSLKRFDLRERRELISILESAHCSMLDSKQ